MYESDILVGPCCLDIHYFVPISLNLKASFFLKLKLQFFTCICCPFATLTNLLLQRWGIYEVLFCWIKIVFFSIFGRCIFFGYFVKLLQFLVCFAWCYAYESDIFVGTLLLGIHYFVPISSIINNQSSLLLLTNLKTGYSLHQIFIIFLH